MLREVSILGRTFKNARVRKVTNNTNYRYTPQVSVDFQHYFQHSSCLSVRKKHFELKYLKIVLV